EGWAFRHRTLPDGRRQVLDFVLPGDLCDPTVFVTPRANFSLQALTGLRYARVPETDLLELLQSHPRIGAAFWWSEAHEEAITRAHLTAVGRLTAYERVAYLLWELWIRLSLVDLADGPGFVLPATQELIADAAGLSTVHVSRMLGRLTREGLISRQHQNWRILDVKRLQRIVQVTDGLHLTPLPPWIQRRLRG
ncbi:MAG: Crp/Fnr family transcriptional regulator, partial [Gammaproteobacteria bacterium]|nr:Crp/Fnr family transcriptional regulator [Gammaproteobacteria bacterium]